MTWDPYKPVQCHDCEGRSYTERRRAGGTTVRRACRTCISTPGWVLQGNPPESPYLITFDFCAGMYDSCKARA